jgi:beta-glucosidase
MANNATGTIARLMRYAWISAPIAAVMTAIATFAAAPSAVAQQVGSAALTSTPHPSIWPTPHWPLPVDPAIEQRVQALLSRMTLEEKVGQVIQGDIASLTPEDVRTYHLGSVLNGGNSGPGGDDFAPERQRIELDASF